MQLGAVEAAIASTAQAAHGLEPAEDLLDALSDALGHGVSRIKKINFSGRCFAARWASTVIYQGSDTSSIPLYFQSTELAPGAPGERS